MSHVNQMQVYPTMESFLNDFPQLKDYMLECGSAGEQMTHLNIVIANIRHIIGWSTINQPYDKHISVDLQHHKNMHELARIKSKTTLEILLKCAVHILWIVMNEAFHSETLLEGETINIDLDHMKHTILKYGSQ